MAVVGWAIASQNSAEAVAEAFSESSNPPTVNSFPNPIAVAAKGAVSAFPDGAAVAVNPGQLGEGQDGHSEGDESDN